MPCEELRVINCLIIDQAEHKLELLLKKSAICAISCITSLHTENQLHIMKTHTSHANSHVTLFALVPHLALKHVNRDRWLC